MTLNRYFCFLLLASSLVQPALAEDTLVSITPLESWSNMFGDSKVSFHFAVRSKESFSGKIGWRFSSKNRTIARGECDVTSGPGQDGRVEIDLSIPAVKEGVEMDALLSVSVFDLKGGKALAVEKKKLWIFGKDPFVGRTEWLKAKKISLFDPDEETAGILEDAGIPFVTLNNVDALSELNEGVLLIGEGISLADYRGLWGEMMKLAAKGLPILCMALSDGDAEIPGEDDDLPDPLSMSFKKRGIIKVLDKRLDVDAWASDGKVVLSSMVLMGERGCIKGSMQDTAEGWPWVEFGFGGKGRLLVCGFSIVGKWESSPTPRFLFARILEYVTKETQKGEVK